MKSKTMILMGVAIVCGLVASILTSRLLSQQGQQQAQKKTVTVLVAKAKLGLGTMLKEPEKLFVEKEFLAGSEPKDAIRDVAELKGRRLNKPLNSEVHITKEDLFDERSSSLEDRIPEGYRAVAIKVNAETNVGNFNRPDARVDVIATITRGGDKGMISRILLQNVRVLAADTKDTRDGDQKVIQANTVTLQVKPDEAEKLRIAGAMGELSLVLRGYDDDEGVKTRGARPTDVISGATGGGGPDSAEDGPWWR
jgi:pilus assembly protein CpaB